MSMFKIDMLIGKLYTSISNKFNCKFPEPFIYVRIRHT